MIRIARFFFLLLFCCCGKTLFAQNKIIDSLHSVLKTAKEDTNKVNTLNVLSSQLQGIGKYQLAIKYADSALFLSQKINFKKGIAKSYKNYGTISWQNLGKYPEALKYYSDALKIMQEIGDKQEIANIYHTIGRIYSWEDIYPEALKNYLASIKIKEEIGDKKGLAYSYHNIGMVYGAIGNYSEALKNYLTALKIKEEIGDKASMISTYHVIGFLYERQDNFSEALKNHLSALKLSEEIGDKGGIADEYGVIGNMYNDQGNYPEALKYYFNAVKLFEEIGDTGSVGLNYNNIANIYYKQGKASSDSAQRRSLLDEAVKYQLFDLKIAEEHGDKGAMSDDYNNLGLMYYHLGNHEEGLKYLFASLKIREEIRNKIGSIGSYQNIGKVYVDMKKISEANKFLNEALFLSKEIGSKAQIKSSYFELAKFDSAIGNWDEAYQNYKSFILYRDSLVNEENTKKTLRLQMQYDFDKKEAAEKLEQEQKLADEKLKYEKEKADHEKELAIEKVKYENEMVLQKAQQAQAAAEEKVKIETAAAQEKAKIEKTAADAKLQNEQAIANERMVNEKTKAAAARKNNMVMMIFVILVISIIFTGLMIRQRILKRRSIEKANAAHKMAELELQSLRSQLNPHFMFNSLNAIQELIVMEENELSQSYLERFAKLLRILLENANQPFIPLRKEIDFLQQYLSLESLRIPDLKYSFEVDPLLNTEKTMIPNMILQPYIENALWHGLQNKQGEKKLQLHIYRQNSSLHYDIIDNGVGREKAAGLKSLYRKEHKSKGMELLSKRFSLLSKEYGQDIQTKVTDVVENDNVAGTLVEITVPFILSEPIKTPVL